jgi:hypothetical protein
LEAMQCKLKTTQVIISTIRKADSRYLFIVKQIMTS